jgi:hypothetical protein
VRDDGIVDGGICPGHVRDERPLDAVFSPSVVELGAAQEVERHWHVRREAEGDQERWKLVTVFRRSSPREVFPCTHGTEALVVR